MATTKKLAIVITGVCLASLLAGFAAGRAYDDRKHYPNTASDLPYSLAVETGNTVYLAGTIGVAPGTREVPDDPKEEARNAMNNIKTRLEAAGLTMDDLVVVQVFCSDVKHYDAFNEVYRTYFKDNFPARAFIGAGTLLFNARFEVQGIAVRR